LVFLMCGHSALQVPVPWSSEGATCGMASSCSICNRLAFGIVTTKNANALLSPAQRSSRLHLGPCKQFLMAQGSLYIALKAGRPLLQRKFPFMVHIVMAL